MFCMFCTVFENRLRTYILLIANQEIIMPALTLEDLRTRYCERLK